MSKVQKVYQYRINDHSVYYESDWEICSEDQYNEMDGYGIERRIIEREVVVSDWDDLWYEFTKTPQYRQSIAALHVRAYLDWLKDNFNAPTKK
jgi:hypothetical protein